MFFLPNHLKTNKTSKNTQNWKSIKKNKKKLWTLKLPVTSNIWTNVFKDSCKLTILSLIRLKNLQNILPAVLTNWEWISQHPWLYLIKYMHYCTCLSVIYNFVSCNHSFQCLMVTGLTGVSDWEGPAPHAKVAFKWKMAH